MASWRLAKSLLTLRNQIDTAAPYRSKAADGSIGDQAHAASTGSDHNPWVGPGVVTAIDVTHDPAHGCDVWVIAQAIAASKDRRLKYLIYTGHAGGAPGILSSKVSPWKWRTRAVDDHPHHLHISVMPDPALYDSVARWALTPPAPSKPAPGKPIPGTVPTTPKPPPPDPFQEDTKMDRLVIALYRRLIGRVPSEQEVDTWLVLAAQGAWTSKNLAAQIGATTEAKAHAGKK